MPQARRQKRCRGVEGSAERRVGFWASPACRGTRQDAMADEAGGGHAGARVCDRGSRTFSSPGLLHEDLEAVGASGGHWEMQAVTAHTPDDG